ncbi:MAG: tryptophan synthase subunit alpha [Myxococcota bacterium]
MNRIDRALARAREEKRGALIVFVTAGDPDLDTTVELVGELAAAGADVIELGVPHSDPIAEGLTIQAASARALARGVTLSGLLAALPRMRKICEAPIVLMGYLNNVLAFGPEPLAEACSDVGVDGLIVADAPYDEAEALQSACEAHGVHRILLVAPTSTPERVVQIARRSRGFVYCVAVTGVTGERAALPQELEELVARIRRVTATPVAVGFGIAAPRQAAAVAAIADAVIVGSALVRRIGEASSSADGIRDAAEFVRELSHAIRAASSR